MGQIANQMAMEMLFKIKERIKEGAHLVTALCFGILFIINVLIFVKYILPMYKKAFKEEKDN